VVLAYTEREIGRAFASAEATFDPYTPADLETHGLAALRWTVLARKAETLYRMGRRAEARRAWSRLVRLDPLDPGVLRNLAVCDTACGELLRALDSWKGYLELLYFFDVVADDPRPHAQERAELHRAVGHSYAPPALYQKEEDWEKAIDPVSVIAFLSSPGGVRNFVEHKLLEFFNVRLQPTSPPVIVGIGRSDPKEARDRATAQWDEFQKKVNEVLPERLRPAVAGVVKRHVEHAIEECENVTRLAQKHDPTYGEDRKRLLELVIDLCRSKFRFGLMLIKSSDLAGQLATFDGLVELLRLDEAPVEANSELFETAAAKLRMDTDTLRRFLSHTAVQFVLGALQYILDVPTDDADAARRKQLFGRMVDQVVPHPALKNAAAYIDAPHGDRALTKKWLGDEDAQNRVRVLRRWHQSFPAMAGVAFGFMQALLHLRDLPGANVQALQNEAIAALEVGARQGFHGPSVQLCIRQLIAFRQSEGDVAGAMKMTKDYMDSSTNEKSRAILARMYQQLQFQDHMEHERFEDALRVGMDLLENDDRDFQHAEQLIKAFGLAATRRKRDPGRAALNASISAWAERAQAKCDRHDDDAVAPNIIAGIKALRDEALVQSVVSEHTDASGATDPKPLIGGLDALLKEYPNLASAYFQRMLAWDAISEDSENEKEKADARRKAVADAKEVLQRTTDQEKQKVARELLERDEPPMAEESAE
jgi:tetratricopeptide (TPR) repeat protein